ncbi:minor capsid protein [Paenibacillus kribbensis]|uniref:minor capsid protein n=1 Tax=Paenibacillus kribbensis TaxID=172713 RepID=UPI002DBCFE44|nr:minor capsid protein [Paenibacillus kribbensis]MEC0234448.1 minor capsid protein [Paenibacillus kribbensis]
MKSEEYWSKRMETLNEAQLKKGEDYIKAQSAEYDKALARINKETESWYARLAKNNEISMAEARKLLKANELKEFRWSVEDYIKAGRENAVDQRWMKELENVSAKVHITRLEELQLKIRQEVEVLTARQVRGATGVLGDIYEDGYYKGIYEVQRGAGKGIPFAKLDGKQIDKVLAKPWAPDGRNFSARIWGDRDKLLAELQTTLTQNLIRGEPSDKVISAFAERMGVSKRYAKRLILTEAAYFSGQSRMDGYKAQGVKSYRFVATLDILTSNPCREMDGEVIPINEAQPGANYPPLHAYCRSTTIPVFDDEAEDSEEQPQERTARGTDGNTYRVPADMSYKEWSAKHVPKDDVPEPQAARELKFSEIEIPGTPGTPIPPRRTDQQPVTVPDPVTPPAVRTTTPSEPDFEEIDVPGSQQQGVPIPPKLSEPEEAAVSRYIGGESYVLNEKLREGKPLSSDEMQWVQQLDSALNKVPRFTGDLTRSIYLASIADVEEFMQDITPGAVIQYPQYVSTTAGAMYNAEGQIHYYILNASMGADLRSYNPGELEVLYGRDFPFEVVSIELINGVYHILLRELRK